MYMRDGTRVQVNFLKVVRLQLSTRNFLELPDVVYNQEKFDIHTYFG